MGDVVGKSGRQALKLALPALQEEHDPLFTIVNGENSAGGVGITPDIANDFFDWGVDGITLGNHAFNKREIVPYLDSGRAIIRPSNMPPGTPGKGCMTLSAGGISLFIANVCGQVYMDNYDDPFREITRLIEKVETPHRFLDFHAEATSEKIATGWYFDGRFTAIAGTHTHVQTNDDQILPGGTAYISDVGMTGPMDGVLGMDRSIVIKKFLDHMPTRFETSNGPGVVHGIAIRAKMEDGKAVSVEKFAFSPK